MSKKRKKQALTPWSLGSLPLSEVPVKNPAAPLDRATLLKQLRDDEEQKRLAADPVYQYEQSMTAVTRERRRLAIQFWSRPVEDLQKDKDAEGAVDPTFDVPTYRSEYTFDDAKSAFNRWFDTTFTPSGISMSESAGRRLVRFGLANAKAGRDFSEPSNWQAAYLHLRDVLEAFAEGELIGYTRPKPVAAPALKATLNDIETLNISGNESDARKAKEITQELMYAESSPLHREWVASLYANFNFVPTNDALHYIYDELFPRNNWSYVDRRSFDRARRAMVAQGRWPESLLTEQDLQDREIEMLDTARLSFADRQRLNYQLTRQRGSRG